MGYKGVRLMAGFIHTHWAMGATGAALTFVPAADSEIQPYFDVDMAKVLTVQGNVSALTLAVFGELTFLQEAAYANIHFAINNQNDGVVATGEPNEQAHTPVGRLAVPDMDMTATPDGPGSDTAAVAIHVAYKTPPAWPAGKMIVVKVTGTGDDSTAWTAFAGGVIQNLDPKKVYALVGLCPRIQDQAGVGIRVTCPSLEGLKPGCMYANGGTPSFWKDEFGNKVVAGTIPGNQTITLESLSHVAQAPDCLVYLIEMGNQYVSPPQGNIVKPTGSGIPQQGGLPQPSPLALDNILGLGSLFG